MNSKFCECLKCGNYLVPYITIVYNDYFKYSFASVEYSYLD